VKKVASLSGVNRSPPTNLVADEFFVFHPVGSGLEQDIGEEEEEDDIAGGTTLEQARRLAYLLTGNSPLRIGHLILASGAGRSFPGYRQRRASLRSGEDVDPVPNLEGRKLMKSGEFGSVRFSAQPG